MIYNLFSRAGYFAFSLIFLVFCTTINADTLSRIQINIENAETVAQQFIEADYDVLTGGIRHDSFELIVTSAQQRALKQADYTLVELERGHPFAQHPDAVLGLPLKDILHGQSIAPPPSGYKDLNAVLQAMQATAQSHPSIAEFVDLTLRYALPATVEGRHIFAIKISDNVNAQEDEPTALVVSNHHAREIVTPELALYAMQQLTEQYTIDPNVTAAVNNHEIWIVPVWNPDGYNFVFTNDNLWRKNRRVFSSAIGVDLNRNYPIGWSTSCGGSSSPSSNTFRGPAEASEAETNTMITFTQDRHFFKVIDFHSSGRETLFGYPPSCATHPFNNSLRQQAQIISNNMGYGGRVRPPSAFGEHYEWQMTRGAHAFLVETATQFQPSHSSALQEAQQVWPGILQFLQRSIPLSGKITDAATGAAINTASIVLPGVNFNQGEVNSSDDFGRYQVFAPPGQRLVRFQAPGFIQQQSSVTLSDTTGTILDVQLSKLGGNVAPSFTAKPIIKPKAVVASLYNNSIATNATDPNPGDVLSFAKVSGPAWLSVSSAGDLSGTPQNTDTGSNSFQVSVTDPGGLSDTAALNILVDTQAGGDQLINGVPVTGLAGAINDQLRFTMDVPEGTTTLEFSISGGTGDADLFVRFEIEPTTGSFDCHPRNSGNEEVCLIDEPEPGIYHIMLRGFSAFSGVQLLGSHN